MANLAPTYWTDRSFIADGAITQYTVVKLSTDSSDGDCRVATSTSKDSLPIGIAQETAADGAQVRVRVAGESYVKADGAYSLSDELAVTDTDGTVDTHTDTAGDNSYSIGVAMEAAAAAADVKLIKINIYSKQFED